MQRKRERVGGGGGGGGEDSDSDDGEGGAKRLREGVLAAELTPSQRVTLTRPHTAVLVNIREYYVHKATGKQRPTKKGVTLNQEQWAALLGGAAQLQQHAEVLGAGQLPQAQLQLLLPLGAGNKFASVRSKAMFVYRTPCLAGACFPQQESEPLLNLHIGCPQVGCVALPPGTPPRIDIREWVPAPPGGVI